MQKVVALIALWLVAACPAAARQKPFRVTCATVRAYVAQVGLQQARSAALAHGMTARQERLARQCLGN